MSNFKKVILAGIISTLSMPTVFANQQSESAETKVIVKAESKRKLNSSNYDYKHNINYNLVHQIESLTRHTGIEQEKLNEMYASLETEENAEIKKKLNKEIKAQVRKLDILQKNVEEVMALNNRVFEESPARFIIVNIPSYQLVAYNEQYEPVLESKVIVGNVKTKTPLDKIDIVSLKYNPTWTPTNNMVKRMLFKSGKLDVNYLISHNLIPYLYGEEVSYEELEAMDLNLQDFKEMGSSLLFIQGFGKDNPLGALKFETNSKQNIYLHDTNSPEYYKKERRDLSSGCIRVQNYLDLASWLKFGHGENKDDIKNNIHKGKTFYQKVGKTPVYFTNLTMLVDEEDNLLWFKDIYQTKTK